MINRDNKELELAVKHGIRISKNIGDISALLNLKKAGVPNEVIKRVLFEPQKVRSTDLDENKQKIEVRIDLVVESTKIHKLAW